MVIKKVLGFATTMSFILLVMVAPTTTASLQQQEDNVTTTDEPNIPIGPKEVDKLPILEEPIPDNRNETDDAGGVIRDPIYPEEEEQPPEK